MQHKIRRRKFLLRIYFVIASCVQQHALEQRQIKCIDKTILGQIRIHCALFFHTLLSEQILLYDDNIQNGYLSITVCIAR